MPAANEDWLCPECVAAGLCIITAVTGKRKHKRKVQYKVSCAGKEKQEWDDYANLKTIPHVLTLMREFTAQ